MEILKDLQQGMEAVNNVRESNRKVPQENHLAMLADGVGTLGWVAIKPGPDKYIGEVLGGAQFYGNKIMTTFKGQYVRIYFSLSDELTHIQIGTLPTLHGFAHSSN